MNEEREFAKRTIVEQYVVPAKAEGPPSHYLERCHFGFLLNICSGTSCSPPANKEKINLC
jgi:hypothetical protein